MVRDKGYTLATYMYGEGIKPLRLNFNTYANRQSGYGSVPVADVTKLAYQRLFNSSKITQIKPEKLDFYFNFGESKVLPIRMTGTVVPEQIILSGTRTILAKHRDRVCQKQILDSLKHIRTSPLNIVNFSDTVIRSVPLERIKGRKNRAQHSPHRTLPRHPHGRKHRGADKGHQHAKRQSPAHVPIEDKSVVHHRSKHVQTRVCTAVLP